MSGAKHWEQDKDSTLYVGNIDERCTDAIIWELMLQAGPVINVHLPKDRVTQSHQGYGFVEFGSEQDADYAVRLMNSIRLFGKPIRVNKASADKRGQESGGGAGANSGVGAELFVGNLDTYADEKVLFEAFSRFGSMLSVPKIARDDANLSKGYGFISYASFESSDTAIENLHGQYLMNKEITVQYAYKKDGKGERHGDAAERALAAQAKKHGVEVAIPAMPAALVMPNHAPAAPPAMNGSYNSMPPPVARAPPPMQSPYPSGGYNNFPPPSPMQAPPHIGYNAMPAPVMTGTIPGAPQAPPRGFNQSPLQTAPMNAGLPQRPPPSMVGYGGPPGMGSGPPGMPPPGMGPGHGLPQPPGFPPGMRAPNGAPPGQGR